MQDKLKTKEQLLNELVELRQRSAKLEKSLTDLRQAEEHIRYLAAFPDLNPNPIIEVDSCGEITFFNLATEKVLEDMGMDKGHIKALLPEDLRAALRDLSKKSKPALSREVIIKDRVFSENICFTPLFNVALIYVTDITELKRTEIVLRESEERFRAFMDNSPAIAWAKDEHGRHTYTNRACEQRFGVRLGDWRGKTDFELWPPKVARRFRQSDLAVLATGHTQDTVEEAVEPDGSHSWWWTFKFPFQDTSGRRYAGGIGVDITERKQMEEELGKLAAVVRHSSELINLATLNGQMTYLNDAGASMLGLSAEEVEQTNIMQVIPVHLRGKVQHEILPALKDKGSWEGELQYCNRKTDELIDVYATTFVINDPTTGSPRYLANTSRDISDRKRAEEALQKAHDELELLVQERTAEIQEAYGSL